MTQPWLGRENPNSYLNTNFDRELHTAHAHTKHTFLFLVVGVGNLDIGLWFLLVVSLDCFSKFASLGRNSPLFPSRSLGTALRNDSKLPRILERLQNGAVLPEHLGIE